MYIYAYLYNIKIYILRHHLHTSCPTSVYAYSAIFNFFFFLRDFIFKKTLFEKLQYQKQELELVEAWPCVSDVPALAVLQPPCRAALDRAHPLLRAHLRAGLLAVAALLQQR